MKILLVDDDDVSRDVLATMIARLPDAVEVVQAEDGEQAWERLSTEPPPDLCCCDLHMPRLGGVGLLQRARADSLLADLPFVMISSAADRPSVTLAVQSGANDFIVKPYSAATVSRAIEKALREARIRAAEPVGEVRRRLSMSHQEVLALTQRLRDELDVYLTTNDTTEETRLSTLKRLHSGCVLLGLHRAAAMLKRAGEPSADRREQLVSEAARFSRQWLAHLQAAGQGT
jgi:two-component system chemotaxis response regulator CheY